MHNAAKGHGHRRRDTDHTVTVTVMVKHVEERATKMHESLL